MRLFIAAPLTPPVQEAIQNLNHLYNLPGLRLVPEANLHLTMHFLGETSEAKLPDIVEKLNDIGQNQKAFNLKFREIAPGPKLNSPRLIWVRFQEHAAFENLAQAISTALPENGNGHPDFIPHITIARIKKEKLSDAVLPIVKEVDFPEYPVKIMALWQSVLGSPHPRYSVVQEFALAA